MSVSGAADDEGAAVAEDGDSCDPTAVVRGVDGCVRRGVLMVAGGAAVFRLLLASGVEGGC